MRIGIVGSGNMGGALGLLLARKGHEVCFSFARTSEALNDLAVKAGENARTGTPEEAAQFGDLIFLSVPYDALNTALDQAGGLEDKVVMSCVSGLRPSFDGTAVGLATDRTQSVAEEIQQLRPKAFVIEAFNSTFAEILGSEELHTLPERPGLFYCGEEGPAKERVRSLIEECGYEPIDLGGLNSARTLETFASIWVQLAVVGGMFPGVAWRTMKVPMSEGSAGK